MFVDAVRDCLKTGGYASKHAKEEAGGTLLVGVAGRLFKVDSDYQVGEPVDSYDACGCGTDVALGSQYATDFLPPKVRQGMALTTAEHHSSGVCSPFTILSSR